MVREERIHLEPITSFPFLLWPQLTRLLEESWETSASRDLSEEAGVYGLRLLQTKLGQGWGPTLVLVPAPAVAKKQAE